MVEHRENPRREVKPPSKGRAERSKEDGCRRTGVIPSSGTISGGSSSSDVSAIPLTTRSEEDGARVFD